MTHAKTCRLVTLGCKVNQYETQLVQEALEAGGYRAAGPGERADLCVVNTCTVTGEADAQARQLIRRLARANPGAAVAVMGCYATRDPDTVRRLPGVTHVFPDKRRLAEELRPFGITGMPAGISRFDDHQRAFVKVQDGCLLNCTFCIIPQVRPVVRSRPIEEIEAEVARLVASGYREIVLTGIHLGHYGIDLSRGRPKAEWTRLWHLIDRLAYPRGSQTRPVAWGDFRIRLSSLEAAEVRDDLIAAIVRNPRVCPHLHLCLQSGSDAVLARMKRRYRVRSYLERVRQICRAVDCPAITTDVIVGFPGESDADFEATCTVARQVGFAKMHIFPFSPRKGTPAAEMPDQVPPPVVAERRARLMALDHELSNAYQRQLLGRELEVLVERVSDRPGHVLGTACRKVTVELPGGPELRRQLIAVRAEHIVADRLVARPLPGPIAAPSQAPRLSLELVPILTGGEGAES